MQGIAKPLLLRAGVACMLAMLIGLPITDTISVAAFLMLLMVAAIGTEKSPEQPKLAAVAGVLTIWGISTLIEVPAIEEGHNVLIFLDGDSAALRAALPPPIYQYAKGRFEETYPADKGCRPDARGCWRSFGNVQRPYAFSADGAFQNPLWSRQVHNIDFDSTRAARLGFLNAKGLGDVSANWYESISTPYDPRRGQAPYFVRYRFNSPRPGARLCWEGEAVVIQPGEQVSVRGGSAQGECFSLDRGAFPLDIIGLQFGPEAPLSMKLHDAAPVKVLRACKTFLSISAAALLAFTFFRPVRRRSIPAVLITSATFVVAGGADHFREYAQPLLAGGDDPLTHWGFGRWILESAAEGDWHQALMGVEPTFYFMPGYRYFRAAEMALFGDSGFGTYCLLLLYPWLVFVLFRQVVEALPATLITVATLTGGYVGEIDNLAEAVGYPFAVIGLIFGTAALNATRDLRRSSPDIRLQLFGSSLAIAVAVLMRPNLLPAGLLYLAGLFWCFRPQGRQTTAARDAGHAWALMLLGFSPVGLLLVHNLYFGGEWVVLTKAAGIPENLKVQPGVLVTGLYEGFVLRTHTPAATQVAEHMKTWALTGGGTSVVILIVFALMAAIAAAASGNVKAAISHARDRLSPAVYCVGLFCAGLQGVLLFYNPTGRYAVLASVLTLGLLVTVISRLIPHDGLSPVHQRIGHLHTSLSARFLR
jgi:hypothetical protein